MHMTRMNRFGRVAAGAAIVAAAALLGACSLDKQQMPPLSGPSELALSLSMTATPDQLPRDGSSQSVVTITARGPQGQPLANQHVTVSLDVNAPQGATL